MRNNFVRSLTDLEFKAKFLDPSIQPLKIFATSSKNSQIKSAQHNKLSNSYNIFSIMI